LLLIKVNNEKQRLRLTFTLLISNIREPFVATTFVTSWSVDAISGTCVALVCWRPK